MEEQDGFSSMGNRNRASGAKTALDGMRYVEEIPAAAPIQYIHRRYSLHAFILRMVGLTVHLSTSWCKATRAYACSSSTRVFMTRGQKTRTDRPSF
jgi:hypothetical protein